MYKALFLHSLLKDFYNFFSSVCLWWIQLEWMYPCDSSWRACLFIFLGEICGKELLGHRAGVSSVYVSGTATCFPIWNLLAFEIPDQTVCLIICSLIKHSLLFFFLCLGRAIVKKQVHLFTPPYIHTLGNIILVVPSLRAGVYLPLLEYQSGSLVGPTQCSGNRSLPESGGGVIRGSLLLPHAQAWDSPLQDKGCTEWAQLSQLKQSWRRTLQPTDVLAAERARPPLNPWVTTKAQVSSTLKRRTLWLNP